MKIMTDDIITGISQAIAAEYPAAEIYADNKVEQGSDETCFFISIVSSSRRQQLGRRYFDTRLIEVTYFPAENDDYADCAAVGEALMGALEIITVGGSPLRGEGLRFEIVDGILHFFVSYDFFVTREAEAGVTMQTLRREITTDG